MFKFVRTEIDYDENEFGEMRYLVHSWWRQKTRGRKGGTLICIPDSKGWETKDDAELEVIRIHAQNGPKYR